jgi:hypothetical protein
VLRLRQRGIEKRLLVRLALAGGSTWAMILGPASEAPTYVFLAPFLAWGLVDRHGWPRRLCVELAGLFVLVFGWSELTRPFWPALPLLLLFLPAGALLYGLWLAAAAHQASCQEENHKIFIDAGPASVIDEFVLIKNA